MGNSGGGITTGMSGFALSQQRYAAFIAERQRAAAIQGARAKQQFAQYVATKKAYRQTVIAEARRLDTEPRWSKREQRRINLIAKHEQERLERMTYTKQDRQPSRSAVRKPVDFQRYARR